MTADLKILGCPDVSLVWQFIMNKVGMDQRLQVVHIYYEKYDTIPETHQALRAFCRAHNRPS